MPWICQSNYAANVHRYEERYHSGCVEFDFLAFKISLMTENASQHAQRTKSSGRITWISLRVPVFSEETIPLSWFKYPGCIMLHARFVHQVCVEWFRLCGSPVRLCVGSGNTLLPRLQIVASASTRPWLFCPGISFCFILSGTDLKTRDIWNTDHFIGHPCTPSAL